MHQHKCENCENSIRQVTHLYQIYSLGLHALMSTYRSAFSQIQEYTDNMLNEIKKQHVKDIEVITDEINKLAQDYAELLARYKKIQTVLQNNQPTNPGVIVGQSVRQSLPSLHP